MHTRPLRARYGPDRPLALGGRSRDYVALGEMLAVVGALEPRVAPRKNGKTIRNLRCKP
jgi:hypothetical protein